jgi:branched-chain amino acid aminotransferase
MTNNNARLWEVSKIHRIVEIDTPITNSLDVITRQLPQGFYTTFRTMDGGTKVLGLASHLNRLYQPAMEQGITPSISLQDLRASLGQLARKCSPADSRIRLILCASDSPGNVYAIIKPFQPLPADIYQNGVQVLCRPLKRITPHLKSTTFIERSLSARQLLQGTIFEVLIMRNERILEGLTSSFFYVKDGVLGTARKNILLGITRRTVLQVGRGIGLDILYRSLKREQVPALEEAFLTSSSRGIVPIIQIDHTQIGEGKPGKITKKLISSYSEYVLQYAENI